MGYQESSIPRGDWLRFSFKVQADGRVNRSNACYYFNACHRAPRPYDKLATARR